MSDWQGAWYIFRSEMRQSWIGGIITILFFIYVGLIMMPNLNEMLMKEESRLSAGWIADFIYLTLLPMMSFLMNRSIFRCRTEDPYTKRLAYYKTMPISLNAIVIARIMQLFAVLIPVATFFYTVQYVFTDELNELLSIEQYLIFVFIWIGYSIIVGCAFVYLEQAYSGRIYFNVSLISMVLYIILAVILWAFKADILLRTMYAAKNMELMWPLFMNVFAGGVVALTAAMVRRRLAARDFHH